MNRYDQYINSEQSKIFKIAAYKSIFFSGKYLYLDEELESFRIFNRIVFFLI